MHWGRALSLFVLASVLVGQPRRARAYDPSHTHRWIARKAVEHLVALYPGQYDELLAYVDQVAAGAEHEDDLILDGDTDPTTARVMRHFYRATDGLGLSYGGTDFPSSYVWGVVGSEQNEWDYGDALAAYQRGDKEAAYFIIGHIVHLVSDLTVPAHSHLDAHGPPTGDDYEGYCSSQMQSEFDGALPTPAPRTPLPVVADLEELWVATASASYWRNMYPGDLSSEKAAGVLVEMFPDIEVDWLSGEWKIPGVGTLGSAFIEEQPGWFYFAKNGAVPAVDKIEFDAYDPMNPLFAANDGGEVMTARMAEHLIPVAIVHSAAALKIFADEAAALPPLDDSEEPADMLEPSDAGGCRTASGATGGAALLIAFAVLLSARKRIR